MTAAHSQHFHDARDNLYGISETGDEALKHYFSKSILEMRYHRSFYKPKQRAKVGDLALTQPVRSTSLFEQSKLDEIGIEAKLDEVEGQK